MKRSYHACLALILVAALFSACTPGILPENRLAGTSVATPTAGSAQTLTICTGSEPATLYIYDSPAYIKSAVLEAVYDGPIDSRSYDFLPIILERQPSLSNGDAVIEPVVVPEGSTIVDANGLVVQLLPGVVVNPSGCRRAACSVTYRGGDFEMDRMAVSFQILAGVMWADGTPLTAHDSVFSYQIAIHPDTPYGVNGLASGSVDTITKTAEYTALDDQTIRWRGLPGFLDPNYRANFFTPLPEHQLGGYSASDLLQSAEEVNHFPLGWGPYVISDWTPGWGITMQRNPNYFRAGEGLPYFDRVVFRFVGQNLENNLDQLVAGECDILLLDAVADPDYARLIDMQRAGGLTIYGTLSGIWEHLSFGINPAQSYNRPDFFEDIRMRRAIANCIDRRALSNDLYGGLVPVMDTYLPSGHPLLGGVSLTSYPYDPIAGMTQLEQIGWKDMDGDGVRESHSIPGIAERLPLRINFITTDLPLRAEITTRIVAYLEACGFSVVVRQIPSRDLFLESPDAPLYGRLFDLALFSFLVSFVPPCEIAQSSQIPSSENAWDGLNFTGYSNSVYDAACLNARVSLPGSPEYITYHQEAARIFSEDLPYLPLFGHINLTLARTDLFGLITDPTQSSELWNIEVFRRAP